MKNAGEIGDEAIARGTGRTWADWVSILESLDAAKLGHTDIARLLRAKYDASPWWSQMITVRYERLLGLRQKHEKPNGFEINVSRTIDLPLGFAFAAWSDSEKRCRWAPDVQLVSPRRRANHSIRAMGPANSRVAIRFTAKSADRTQIVVEHTRLSSAALVEPHRQFWRSVLEKMGSLRA